MIVEVKAIKSFEDIHFSQVRSYLKAWNLDAGLLINFATTPFTVRRVYREKKTLQIFDLVAALALLLNKMTLFEHLLLCNGFSCFPYFKCFYSPSNRKEPKFFTVAKRLLDFEREVGNVLD